MDNAELKSATLETIQKIGGSSLADLLNGVILIFIPGTNVGHAAKASLVVFDDDGGLEITFTPRIRINHAWCGDSDHPNVKELFGTEQDHGIDSDYLFLETLYYDSGEGWTCNNEEIEGIDIELVI